MSIQIATDADVMRQTMQRIAVSTGISLAMAATVTLMTLGGNPDALVRVGDVIVISLCAATMISAVISGILSYRSALRGGLVARHGGEEFAALMTGISREEAEVFAEEIRRTCAHREIRSGDICETMTISIGFTMARGETDLARIMRIADQALSIAKRQGRDRVVVVADDAPPLAAA